MTHVYLLTAAPQVATAVEHHSVNLRAEPVHQGAWVLPYAGAASSLLHQLQKVTGRTLRGICISEIRGEYLAR
jgi:nanoRNase/pAp phosphatase (c-di-AMP/oligoRNAs hydrolase)